ncbi:unnamed protein product [Hanseniaspora opuntiae]
MKEEFKDELAHALLIELLSFQFASPVKWIETQDVLINKYNIDNLIEIGPQPILGNMMKRTSIGKADSMNLGKQKTSVSTYCVSDIESIPYYYSQKGPKDNLNKSMPKTEINAESVYNPYKDQINFTNNDSLDTISYHTFVGNEKSTKKEKPQKFINEEDIENEKFRFKQLQKELQQSSETSKLMHEYTKVCDSMSPDKKALSSKSVTFEKTKIREYDNPHAWIRSLVYKLASLPTFNPEHYSSIKRLVHVYESTPLVRDEIDSVLEYSKKNISMLQMYLNVYHKEQAAQMFEADDRCDSGVTLYDGDSSSNEDGILEAMSFDSKVVSKWDSDNKTFIQCFDLSNNAHESSICHVFNQCDIVFPQKVQHF